jgi:hypothetical protein
MRLGREARKCVVFFGVPEDANEITYRGTGFLAEFKHSSGRKFRYLITATHVATKLTAGDFIRMNRVDGGAYNEEINRIDWVFHPTSDIAVAPFQWGQQYDVVPLELNYGLTEARRVQKAIDCGDIIYIVGLFRLHRGSKKNVPIVHVGHIAAMPDEEELVSLRDPVTQQERKVAAYLIEAQTLEGLSGSPVFVRRGVKATLAQHDTRVKPLGYGAIFLMGVYLGAWDARPGEILEADRDFKQRLRVPVGIGSVAPFDHIMEVVEGPQMELMRQDEIRRH